MIEEKMYHKIKSYQNLKVSIRRTAKYLNISPTTVQKFRRMSLKEYKQHKTNLFRKPSILEPYNELLLSWIIEYPKIRNTKVHRKFRRLHPNVIISPRAFSSYLRKLKSTIQTSTHRTFTPVSYHPGIQIQVDPGEQKVKLFSGELQKVYFVAFKMSYSRMVYAHFQLKPYNTQDFIKAHEACFKFFGCLPKQLVYDQTKLVVIREIYREVWLNEKFSQYLSKLELSPYICEGYDPQSKGLVERHVREVKEDFLYGEKFSDLSEIILRSKDWFDFVNNRVHSTTLEAPKDMFIEERSVMRTYIPDTKEERKVDKVGFISWKGNKYSVPYMFQQKEVLVEEKNGNLLIIEHESLKQLTSHKVKLVKSKRTVNQNHYIDYSEKLSLLKNELFDLLREYKDSKQFVEKLLKDNPKHPRQQLTAVKRMYKKHSSLNWNYIIKETLILNLLRATRVEEVLEFLMKQSKVSKYSKKQHNDNKTKTSTLARDLSEYDRMCKK